MGSSCPYGGARGRFVAVKNTKAGHNCMLLAMRRRAAWSLRSASLHNLHWPCILSSCGLRDRWSQPRASDAHGLNALEASEPGKVKQKMIVCRPRATYRLPDGTWVMSTVDALKRLAQAGDSRGSRRFDRDEIYDERLNRYKPR